MIESVRGKALGVGRALLSMPFIYGMLLPVLVLDVCTQLYHAVCFPLYGIPRVRRADHVRDTRSKLAYLSGWDRVNCHYCGYANGTIDYVREVAARTERYWCPIKQKLAGYVPPAHHADFAEQGDRKGLEERLRTYPPASGRAGQRPSGEAR